MRVTSISNLSKMILNKFEKRNALPSGALGRSSLFHPLPFPLCLSMRLGGEGAENINRLT
jgi:hypothetical protein